MMPVLMSVNSQQHSAPISLKNKLDGLRSGLNDEIIGQSESIDLLLTSLLADGHVLLIGVPGLAKTKLVKTLARRLSWQFRRIQFTPDLMPSDILGMEILRETEQGSRELAFVKGPIFTNLLLADEINRTPPRTQSALLEAMQEKQVTINHQQYQLDLPFLVIATQNPIEQEGTYPLPEAQLDRFMFSLWIEYPELADEISIAGLKDAPQNSDIDDACLLSKEDFLSLRQQVAGVAISEAMVEKAVRLVRATRPAAQHTNGQADAFIENNVRLGAGSRACQHLVQASQAYAYLHGDEGVTFEHIKKIAHYVLSHRIILSYQGAMNVKPDQIVDHAIKVIEDAE